jgi:hypothetical protein
MEKQTIDVLVQYLEQNKDKYEKDALISELKKGGYSDEDIEIGLDLVYKKSTQVNEQSAPIPPQPVVDDENNHSTANRRDLFIGIFIGGIALFLGNFIFLPIFMFADDWDKFMIVGVLYIIFLVTLLVLFAWYIIKNRKWFLVLGIAIGLITVPLLVFGACFAAIFSFGMF